MVAGHIAVTGATGFVGGHLTTALSDEDLPLKVLIRTPEKMPVSGKARLITGDLNDARAIGHLVADTETVVHCAGLTTAKSPAAYDAVNIAGTAKLVAAAAEAGVKRFILVSSIAAREPGLSAYGASKRGGEAALRRGAGEMSWAILRPPPVYGPRDKGTLPLLKALTRKTALVPGTRNGRFSVIHVADLVTAITALIDQPGVTGGIFELHDGHARGYSWEELAHAAGAAQGYTPKCVYVPRALLELGGVAALGIGAMTGRVPMLTPGKVAQLYHADWVAKHNLLDKHISWQPEIGFERGFKETVAWYRGEGWL